METEQQIRTYVVENFLLGDEAGFDGSESLLEAGVIDSTGVLELVMFLEESFSIHVDDEDMVPENLDRIPDIARFVERKLAGRSDGLLRTGQGAEA
ncbi:MAG: acyl carrier protein [Phycisphaerae bacterium]